MREVCECGKATDDHTLRELRAHHERAGDFMGGGTLSDHGVPAGALVVRALVLSVPDGPTIGLPTALPVLLLDDQRMRGVRTLVGSAVDDSIRLARRAR